MATQLSLDFSPSEYAILSYMSALEIITLGDNLSSKCDKCRQDIYAIFKRVVSLSNKATNGNNYIEKLIKKFYDARSKFVHVGEYLSSNNYTGISIPLLSVEGNSGIIQQNYHFDSMIKELIKECIIWHENNKANIH